MTQFVVVLAVPVVSLDLSIFLLEKEHPVFFLGGFKAHRVLGLPGLVLGVVVFLCCHLCEDNGQEQSQKQGFVHSQLVT